MAPPPAPISLKSRFSKSHNPTASTTTAMSMTPFPIPFNAPISPDTPSPPSHPVLTSRFSNETLASAGKTPRLPSLSHHRWFSSPSPPSSPPSTSKKALYILGASSDSRLNISSPTKVCHGPGSDEEREDEEELAPIASETATGARVVRDVDEAFEFARGHGRGGSGGSNKSTSSPSSTLATSTATCPSSSPPPHSIARMSRSFSSPQPHPSRPKRAIPPPPLPRANTQHSPPRLDHLPPRSDSRNALLAADQVHSRSDSRTGFIPPPPVAKLIASHSAPRPHSPPNPIVPPLLLQGKRAPTPQPTLGPFIATLVKEPSAMSVRNENVRIALDVGGVRFLTSAETLLEDGRGGKIGEFVQGVLDKIKMDSEREVLVVESELRKDSGDSISIYPSSDDGESFMGSEAFDLAPSPFPSPFPFMRYDSGSNSSEEEEQMAIAGLTLDVDGSIVLPTSPSSPIDPFINKLLPPHSTLLPPLNTNSNATSRAKLVTSPLPHLRINSFHPAIYGTQPSPPSATSSSFPSPDEDAFPSPRLSSHSDNSHFDHVLEAFSSIQQSPIPSPTSSTVRDSLGGFPTDVDERNILEDRSRSTLLGVPRGSMKLKGPRSPRNRPPLPVITSAIPKVEIRVEDEGAGTDGSRPPSLISDSSVENEVPKESEMEGNNEMEIFIDRNGKVYEVIIDFLRSHSLPCSHSLPRSTVPTPLNQPDVDATVLSLLTLHPASALGVLGNLKALALEATWLGMEELIEACEMEMERVTEVVKWLEGKRARESKEKKEKAGWI